MCLIYALDQSDSNIFVKKIWSSASYFFSEKFISGTSYLKWSTEVKFWLSDETPVYQRQHFCFDKIMWQWGV